MSQSSKIVFFGNERLSSGFEPKDSPTLTALIKNGYDVVAVVANNREAASRSKRRLEVEQVAKNHRIPVVLPERPTDIHDQLAAYQPDLGVLVAYGKLIPQSIIDIFPKGIVNIHPSLLPQYRGPSPIEQAILDGAKQTGVSIMQLTKGMDAGPLFAQKQITLNGSETKAELTEKLLRLGAELLVEKLPAILDDSLAPTPQNDSKATFSKLFKKEDGVLDPSKPADQLEREIRAYLNWPKSRTELFGQQVIVTKSRIASGKDDGALVVAYADNTYLEIKELVAPSGRTMSGADFLRGYKK